MDAAQLQQIHDSLESILPELELEGLSIADVRFDFYTASVDVVFEYAGRRVRMRMTTEKIQELMNGKTFSIKRLRESLYKTFGVEEE